MRKLFALIAVCALVPFALAACGGDDDEEPAAETTAEDTGGGGGGTVTVAADPGGELAFVQESLSGSAGEITFEFDNPSSTEHDFCVDDADDSAASGEAIFVYHTGASNAIGCTDVITGETTTLTENLDAGEYTFFCSVSGHREAGMEGTLTVK
jgi:uncharacterized cupredoxin-like copper-binding protein